MAGTPAQQIFGKWKPLRARRCKQAPHEQTGERAAGVFGHIGHTSVQAILKAVPVKAIMSAPAVCVSSTADVEEAVRLMRERKIGPVPVVEAGRVVGILTETDVLRHIVRADERCSPDVIPRLGPPSWGQA